MNILPEHSVLKLLLDKDRYSCYNNILSSIYNKDNNIYLYNIYKALEALHSKSESNVSVEDLHIEFVKQHPHISMKERALYDDAFKAIQSSEASKEQVQSLLDGVVQKSRLQNLALAAYEAANSGRDVNKVKEAIESFTKTDETKAGEEFVFITDDLEQLYTSQVQTPGLRWRLASLNQSLGSLREGDFGIVFARPETGKTTFLSSEETYMASQLKGDQGPVIHFNNEEQGEKVKIRQFQAALGIGLDQLFSNRKKNHADYLKVTNGKLILYDDAGLSKSTVEKICKRYKPRLVIFDQIDKIKGFAADRTDLELGAIYQWAREIAKDGKCSVIGVCQADGTAEGERYLNMGHMANAKTAKQAEADWILGIGRSNDPGIPEEVRYFNISKNKLFGDADSIPEKRHGRWDVMLRPLIARYEDMLHG